jgi:hypothetical protein
VITDQREGGGCQIGRGGWSLVEIFKSYAFESLLQPCCFDSYLCTCFTVSYFSTFISSFNRSLYHHLTSLLNLSI